MEIDIESLEYMIMALLANGYKPSDIGRKTIHTLDRYREFTDKQAIATDDLLRAAKYNDTALAYAEAIS